MKLDNTVALVTGANGGLGSHFVEQLLQLGVAKMIPVKVLNLDERKISSALPARVLAALG